MLRDYIAAAMKRARYEILQEDASYYGEIDGFEGVCATAKNLEECRELLESVLEEWIFLRISRNLDLPVVDGIDLKVRKVV